MNLMKMSGQMTKPRSSKIGRRTGVNVVSGKKIRAQGDGTEVFDDYWTDTDGENSIHSSETNQSIPSLDRTRNVHYSKMLSTPDDRRSSRKKITRQRRNEFFDYSVDSSLESSKRAKDHRSRMTQTSYTLVAEGSVLPSKEVKKKLDTSSPKKLDNVYKSVKKRKVSKNVENLDISAGTADLEEYTHLTSRTSKSKMSNVSCPQNEMQDSASENDDVVVDEVSKSPLKEMEKKRNEDEIQNNSVEKSRIMGRSYIVSEKNVTNVSNRAVTRSYLEAIENKKNESCKESREKSTRNNVLSPQTEMQDSASENDDVVVDEVSISPLKEMEEKRTNEEEIQTNSVEMSPRIMGRSYTVSEKNVTNVSNRAITRSYLEAIENKKTESSKKSRKGFSSGKPLNRKSSMSYVSDAYNNVENPSQLTSSPGKNLRRKITLHESGILLSNDGKDDREISGLNLKTANSKRINSPEKSKQDLSTNRKSSMAYISYANDNVENLSKVTSPSPKKALRKKSTSRTPNKTRVILSDNEENDRKVSSSYLKTNNSKIIDSPKKSKRSISSEEPHSSNIGITSSSPGKALRTRITSQTHSKKSILLPDADDEDTNDNEKDCKEVSMSRSKKPKKGFNQSEGKKEDRVSFSVGKSPKLSTDFSQVQNDEGRMSSRSSRKSSRLEISEVEKVADKRTSSMRKSPRLSKGEGVKALNSPEKQQESDMKSVSPVCKAKRKIVFPEPTKCVSRQDEPPPGNVRRSSRMRVPPLASWRNERLAYLKSPSGQFRAFVDKGLPEDDYAYRKLAKKQTKNKVEKREVSKVSRPKKTPIADLVRNKTVKVNIHRPFSSYEWILPKSDECCGCMISRCFASDAITFGFLDISVNGKKTPQFSPTDNIHFVVVKGSIDATVNETSFTFRRGDTFIVPMGTLYSMNNVGSSNALLSFCAFRIPFFQFQDDD